MRAALTLLAVIFGLARVALALPALCARLAGDGAGPDGDVPTFR